MDKLLDQMSILIGGYLPKLIAAVLLLIGGWMLARVIATFVHRGLQKLQFNSHISNWIAMDAGESLPEIDKRLASLTFIFIMFFVLVSFFQVLSLTLITEPLNGFLVQVFEFAPRILSAGIVALLAWVVAGLVRIFIIRFTDKTHLNMRLDEALESKEISNAIPVSKTLSDAAFWLILLLFLPAVLSSLQLDGLLKPVQSMINEVLSIIPNLFAAIVILLVGWFFAKIVQRLITNLGAVSGVNQLAEKAGVSQVLGSKQPTEIIALVVYILILIPVLIAGLNVLKLDALTRPASEMLNTILAAIPLLFAAAIILTIAYFVGRILADGMTELSEGIGVDKLPVILGLTKSKRKPKVVLSRLLGQILLAGIMLFATMEACNFIHFNLMATLIQQFINFFAQMFIGLVILGIALYLAKLSADTILASGGDQASLLASVSQVSIYILGGAMALQQMGFAEDIIKLAFGIIFGSFAVAVAIAFGWGGKDVASQMIQQFYSRHRESLPGK